MRDFCQIGGKTLGKAVDGTGFADRSGTLGSEPGHFPCSEGISSTSKSCGRQELRRALGASGYFRSSLSSLALFLLLYSYSQPTKCSECSEGNECMYYERGYSMSLLRGCSDDTPSRVTGLMVESDDSRRLIGRRYFRRYLPYTKNEPLGGDSLAKRTERRENFGDNNDHDGCAVPRRLADEQRVTTGNPLARSIDWAFRVV